MCQIWSELIQFRHSFFSALIAVWFDTDGLSAAKIEALFEKKNADSS
jgi:hypothetical protein